MPTQSTDPFSWAKEYYNVSSQRAAQEQNDAQRSLLGVFAEESRRQNPYFDLPADFAKEANLQGHRLELADVNAQYRGGLLESRRQYKNANMPAGQLFKLSTDAAKMFNVDPAAALALFSVESEFNPSAVSPTGATGLGQLTQGTAARMGVTDRHDPRQNAAGSMRYYRYVADYLTSHGIEATPANVYIGYQQGEGGAVALLRNPNARAGSVVSANNLRVNHIDPNMSAGEAAAKISAKFRARYEGYKAQLAKSSSKDAAAQAIADALANAKSPDDETATDIAIINDDLTADIDGTKY